MVTAPQVPASRGGLVTPLDFPEYPAIRIDRSLHLLLFRKIADRAGGAGFGILQCPHGMTWIVAFAAVHQFPGNARQLVGKSHCCELGWLALEK